MKKFMMMIAAVAGVSFFMMQGSAEASHRCGARGGFYGVGYAPVIQRGGGFYGHPRTFGHYGHPGFNRGFVPYHRGFGPGYGPGFGPGFYGRGGFGVRTPGFGLYIR